LRRVHVAWSTLIATLGVAAGMRSGVVPVDEVLLLFPHVRLHGIREGAVNLAVRAAREVPDSSASATTHVVDFV
jgi:hypothetical protein